MITNLAETVNHWFTSKLSVQNFNTEKMLTSENL